MKKMRLIVAIEDRLIRVAGNYYSHHLSYDSFWYRYRTAFDQVDIVTRVLDKDDVPEGWGMVNKDKVGVIPLPPYRGPYQYLAKMLAIKKAIKKIFHYGDAVILRIPGNTGTLLLKELPLGYPYGVEVMVDPWDGFAPGSVKSFTRPYFRWRWTKNLKIQCRGTVAASYVTEHALQRRYPPSKDAYTTYYSSIELDDRFVLLDASKRFASIQTTPKRLAGDEPPVRLGFIGSFSQGYKLPDVHIKALARCATKGANVTLEMIGDGALLPKMKRLARKLGVGDRVIFRGRLPGGKPIMDAIDNFDLFLNATAAEGLPRVVIEAMSRGCPCVASRVAGTPELLEESYLVPRHKVTALADTILRVLAKPKAMANAVERNIGIARNYCRDVLQPRRLAFYQALRERTEKYLSKRS